ncbi:hypothetical protein MKX01_032650 [Papaver californicum]|nr:hypothetical protein MKX01_032650 [Papaver californicum]
MEIKENHHIVLFPWLAFGHVIPFLELSKSLASNGNGKIQISFISTPSIIRRLPPIHPPSLKSRINFISIDLPPVDNLPEGCEATVDLKDEEQTQYLKKAYDELQVPVDMVLNQIKPDLIIFDLINCWIPDVGAKLDIPTAFFSVYSTPMLAFGGPPSGYKESTTDRRLVPEDFTQVPKWISFPSTVAYKFYEAVIMSKHINIPDISRLSTGERYAKGIESSNFILARSCVEFDGDYLNLLRDIFQKPVIPIGLLPPPAQLIATRTSDGSANSSDSEILCWLEKQQPKSVVFVGFGSEYKMSIEQIHELALGLELSELPFLWILRKPEGSDESDLLPSGFGDRTKARGFVCLGWISQVEVLSHTAIGGCLFHSGWGSIIETLSFGHPQILLPMMLDQGINARFLVEKGIGHEVERNEDGTFTREAVARSMKTVMVEPEGEQLRLKAAQMGESIFSNHVIHEEYIVKFISELLQLLSKE